MGTHLWSRRILKFWLSSWERALWCEILFFISSIPKFTLDTYYIGSTIFGRQKIFLFSFLKISFRIHERLSLFPKDVPCLLKKPGSSSFSKWNHFNQVDCAGWKKNGKRCRLMKDGIREVREGGWKMRQCGEGSKNEWKVFRMGSKIRKRWMCVPHV